MNNPAWDDDNPMNMRGGSGDPDSQALISGLRFIFWPGWAGLAAFSLLVLVFRLDALMPVLVFCACAWGVAHVGFRPRQTVSALLACWRTARAAFAKGAAGLASLLAPAIARLNLAYHAARKANARMREASAPQAAARGVMADEPVMADKPAAPRQRFDWGAIVTPLGAVLVVALVILFGKAALMAIFGGPSGREVAADFEANVAESQSATREAETELARDLGRNAENRGDAHARIAAQSRQAREDIARANDLEARIAAHRSYDERVRNESARTAAAAVRNYLASVEPDSA